MPGKEAGSGDPHLWAWQDLPPQAAPPPTLALTPFPEFEDLLMWENCEQEVDFLPWHLFT